MKKNLLLAALVVPLLSVTAQWTQVGGTVAVKPGTLKYVQQTYTVNNTVNASKTLNEGKINVRETFQVVDADKADGSGFQNIWTGRNEYGQLIVNIQYDALGKIISQYNLPSGFDFQPLALPFNEYSYEDVHTDTGLTPNYVSYVAGPNNGFMPGRYQNSLWTWQNSLGGPSSFYFENVGPGDFMDPYLYHALNDWNGVFNSGTKSFLGDPHNGYLSINTVSAPLYEMTTAWDVNQVGELYGSYVEDVAVAKPDGWRMATPSDNEQTGVADGVPANGYGNNISLFGNPFTSNINLLGANGTLALTNVSHVYYITSNTYEADGQGSTNPSNVKVTTIDENTGGIATGEGAINASALVIRPHETFFVKARDVGNDGLISNDNPATINLGEAVKTFDLKATEDLGTTPTSRNANHVNDNGFYQVALDIYDQNENDLNARNFVFASDRVTPNTPSNYEAYYTSFGNVGFYSLQENPDGTVYEEWATQKAMINGVNANDYIAKPIHLVFKGNGTFTVKSVLTNNLINSANRFYFEDRETGEIMEVTEDFAYTFTNNGTTGERFFMYWNGLPETMAVEDVAVAAQTVVYKNNREFSIRFADTWNKADVYVYNMLGQLVHTAKGVNAAQDYHIPLKGGAAAYVVKSVSENGEVATQKIVKQ